MPHAPPRPRTPAQPQFLLHRCGGGLLFRCVCSTCLSCVRLCGPEVCSPPGSSVHGDFQARILECVAMPASRGSSRPRDPSCVSYVSCIGRRVPLVPPGKPTRSGILARTVLSPRVCSAPKLSLTLRPHGLQPAWLLRPWDSPGKSGLPFPPRGDLPDSGIDHASPAVLSPFA